MGHTNLDTLIQRIYDAALESERWEDVAHLFRDIFESPGGGLFMQDCCTHDFRPISMYGLPDRYLASYSEYYSQTNAWALAGLQRPGWTITDQSVDKIHNQSGAFAESEFHNDWLKPQGFRYGMGGTVRARGTEYFHYTILRPPDAPAYGDWEVEAFDILKPHLGRAVELGARVRGLEQRLSSHSDMLDRLPTGVLLLDHSGTVRHANRRAAGMMGEGSPLRLHEGRLVSETPGADGRLQKALSAALAFTRGKTSEEPCSAIVSLPDGTYRMSVLPVPLSRARPLFADLSLVLAVFVSTPEEPAPLDPERLQVRYGLTRSEARLTSQLARGQDLKTAAASIGVAHETARGYLKNVFWKTGTKRQAELLGRLLSDATLTISNRN